MTEAEVRAWIRDGELAAEAAGDTWMVRTSVLDAASYEGGMRVRVALNKARLRRFQAKQAGKVDVAPRAREVWRPAERMVPQAAIAELRAQLERLWFPAPAQVNRATSETEWPIVATEALEALQRSMDERVRQELVLRSDAGYSAEAVAELLYAFGFVNAEASSWAWRNGEGCLGDDYILSASHDVPDEVCLWFNVARVAHPQAVARVALAVVRAMQGALGGELAMSDSEGAPDQSAWLATIQDIETTLRAAGLECGGSAMIVL